MIVLENTDVESSEPTRKDALKTILRAAQRYHYASLQDKNPLVAARHSGYAAALSEILIETSSEREIGSLFGSSLKSLRSAVLKKQDEVEEIASGLLDRLKGCGIAVPELGSVIYDDGFGALIDKIKGVIRKVEQVTKAVVTLHRKVERKVFKKVAPKRLQEFVSRLGKKAKPVFLKFAPYIAIAAQLLNLLIPGLGVLVGLAINASATALAIVESRKAKKKFEKAEEAADLEAAQAEAEATKKANIDLMSAYDKGEKYFTDSYGMPRSRFQALSVEDKTRFMDVVIYDQHTDLMSQLKVDRATFEKMPIADQQQALAMMGQELDGAPGTFTPEYADGTSGTSKTISPFEISSSNPYLWVGGAAVFVVGLYFISEMRKASR